MGEGDLDGVELSKEARHVMSGWVREMFVGRGGIGAGWF